MDEPLLIHGATHVRAFSHVDMRRSGDPASLRMIKEYG